MSQKLFIVKTRYEAVITDTFPAQNAKEAQSRVLALHDQARIAAHTVALSCRAVPLFAPQRPKIQKDFKVRAEQLLAGREGRKWYRVFNFSGMDSITQACEEYKNGLPRIVPSPTTSDQVLVKGHSVGHFALILDSLYTESEFQKIMAIILRANRRLRRVRAVNEAEKVPGLTKYQRKMLTFTYQYPGKWHYIADQGREKRVAEALHSRGLIDLRTDGPEETMIKA